VPSTRRPQPDQLSLATQRIAGSGFWVRDSGVRGILGRGLRAIIFDSQLGISVPVVPSFCHFVVLSFVGLPDAPTRFMGTLRTEPIRMRRHHVVVYEDPEHSQSTT